MKVRKPILVGGISLSIAFWLWGSLQHTIAHWGMANFGEMLLYGTIAGGAGIWLWQKRATASPQAPISRSPLTREIVDQAIAHAQTTVAILEAEVSATTKPAIAPIQRLAESLPHLVDRSVMRVGIVGADTSACMKTLSSAACETTFSRWEFVSTPSQVGQASETTTELVLFFTSGDLTASQWQTLEQFKATYQRFLLIYDRPERTTTEQRQEMLDQLRLRLSTVTTADDVIAVTMTPGSVLVRQHQEDGSIREWTEQTAVDLHALGERLATIATQEPETLVLGSTWRTAQHCTTEAKQFLNDSRRERAMPLIEQYQWIAAGTTFVNPVATLDLLATAAITGQLLVDLGDIYRQKLSLSQAQTAAGTLGQLMVTLGLVELSSRAIAGLLKSNVFTFAAGGALQGVSAAYLTRLAGLSLIEYFEEQDLTTAHGSRFDVEKLSQKVKQVFDRNQRLALLPLFVKQAVSRLDNLGNQRPAIASPES